jgi:hypothetical protein
MLFGRPASTELVSTPHTGHGRQGSPDLGVIVFALQAELGTLRVDVLALQVELVELGGLRERVKFLEKNAGSAHEQSAENGEKNACSTREQSAENVMVDIQVVADGREDASADEMAAASWGGGNASKASLWLTEELEQTYELQESMWDAAVYIGTEPFGGAGSAYALFLLVLNVSIQFIFVLLVWGIVETPQFDQDTVDSFRGWRRNIAHDSNQMDVLSQRSLASRVCRYLNPHAWTKWSIFDHQFTLPDIRIGFSTTSEVPYLGEKSTFGENYELVQPCRLVVGPVDPSFRALSERPKFTVRRHKFKTDSCMLGPTNQPPKPTKQATR